MLEHEQEILCLCASLCAVDCRRCECTSCSRPGSHTDAAITGNIAVAGDLILAGDASGKFYAVNKNTGRLAWSYYGKNSIVGTPAVSGSSVVISQADGTIACLNLNNGNVIWNKEAEVEGVGLTVVDGAAIGDGKAYIARGDGVLYALSLTNGQIVWTYRTDSYELRTAPSFSDNYVLLGEQNGKFDMIDPKTGKRVTGGGAVYFLKNRKSKPQTAGDTDFDDYPFDEDEEDDIEEISEDEEVSGHDRTYRHE